MVRTDQNLQRVNLVTQCVHERHDLVRVLVGAFLLVGDCAHAMMRFIELDEQIVDGLDASIERVQDVLLRGQVCVRGNCPHFAQVFGNLCCIAGNSRKVLLAHHALAGARFYVDELVVLLEFHLVTAANLGFG